MWYCAFVGYSGTMSDSERDRFKNAENVPVDADDSVHLFDSGCEFGISVRSNDRRIAIL